MNNERINKIRTLAEKGYMIIDIAQEIGVSKDTVKAYAIKNGIKIKSKSDIVSERKREIIELYKSGKTINELRSLHYSYELIKKTISEFGLEWRDPKKRGEERRLSNEEVLSRIPNSNGCEVIGFEASGNPQKAGKYIIKSPNGTIFKKTAAKLYQGITYRKTGLENFDKFYKDVFDKTGMESIKEGFVNTRKSATFRCPKGHLRELATAGNIFKHGCPICSNTGSSAPEIEILEFVKEFWPSACKYTLPKIVKAPGKSKEIDVYIPELKLGIEYCGLYDHNEESRRFRKNTKLDFVSIPQGLSKEEKRVFISKWYHYDKYLNAKYNGIRLITIFEDEWLTRNSQVKGFLKSIITKASIKYYARELEISEINADSAKNFIDKYHIQGAPHSIKIAFKIHKNEETLGVITGSMHHRQNGNKSAIVLSRLCFKDDICIVGGASRLFTALVKYAQKNDFLEIISWSDNRWSSGNVYEKLKFELKQETNPDYSYYDSKAGKNGIRLSKQSNSKKRLNPTVDSSIPYNERDMAFSIGRYRIWDCGKKRWVFPLK